MDKIKEKSDFNLDAAELLIKNGYHASSVHCSYYGCLQFFKYTLKEVKSYTYNFIEQECLSSRLGSHNYMINAVLNEYKGKTDNNTYVDIKRQIKDLKEFRENSDYMNIEVVIDDSEKCFKISKSIIAEIKKKLKK